MKNTNQAFQIYIAILIFSQTLSGQLYSQRTISGTVIDEQKNPIIGVTIFSKVSSKATTSDASGQYHMDIIKEPDTLLFSYVGYQTKEIIIGAEAIYDVVLIQGINMEEVVVIGYGTQLKKDLTGAVTKINEKDFNEGPVSNPLQLIAGHAAGVSLTQVGSSPGRLPGIRIRGITSLIGGNNPLIVIDGVQGGVGFLRQVPPSEIASIEILKDASATAIYGSRGAAGVLIVTTKKGKEGKVKVEYNAAYSLEKIAKKYDLLNAEEWRIMAAERNLPASVDYGGDTDWLDLITQTGSTQNHNLSFSGGSSNFDYRASLTAIDQKGLVINTNYRSYLARLRATQKSMNDRLSLELNINVSNRDYDYGGGGLGGAQRNRPTDPVYEADGTTYFIDPLIFSYVNPYALTVEEINNLTVNSFFTSGKARFEIIKGLSTAAFGSWKKHSELSGYYLPPSSTVPAAILNNGIAGRNSRWIDEKLGNWVLSYKNTFGSHKIDVTTLYEWQKSVFEGFGANADGFINDEFTYNSLQSADPALFNTGDIWSYKNDRTLISLMGRFNYGFNERYLLTLSARRDGSSVFGANNKWATFPSAAFAWRASEEAFMEGLDFLSNLKIRLGYGITGNQQGLGSLNSIRLVSPDGTTFFGGQLIPNFSITQNVNEDLKWETRTMYSAGIDFELFKTRIYGTVDYYYSTTKDLLFNYTVPQPPYPFGTIKANVGKVLNKGLEISLTFRAVDKPDLKVNLSGNISFNKNEVLDLSGSLNGIALNSDTIRWGAGGTSGVASQNNGISYLITGQPMGSYFLYHHDGIDDSGNQLIADLDKSGVIEDGDRSPDRYIAGQALPKYSYAFTPSFQYKNFDLSILIRGAYGHKIYNGARGILSTLSDVGQRNVIKSALDLNLNTIDYASDLWLEDGGFTRIENITLGYTLKTTNIRWIDHLRFTVTGQNLHVFTKYSGQDPEVRAHGGYGTGIDFGIYPRTRGIAFGLDVSFK